MWRFKVSKFKNAAPKQLKKEEYVSDLPVGNLMTSNGNFVAASCEYAAFCMEIGGHGKVGVLGLDEKGRKDASMPVIYAHSEFVSDLAFSPFHDDLLFTASFDGMVKLWKIPEGGVQEHVSNSLCESQFERRVENVAFHPSAENVVAVVVHDKVIILDADAGLNTKFSIGNESDKTIQSLDWKLDGTLLITSSKDKQLRILDPRASEVSMQTDGNQGIKDSRTKWVGSDTVLSTGFGMNRERVVGLWDTRSFNKPLTSLSIDTSNGILMPFFDPDTNMLFLAGKGDVSIYYYEFTQTSPFLTLSCQDSLEAQTVGMGMVPKRAMDVMSGEVNRLMQLTKRSLFPLKYIVPRKSYRDFHADLFPDTASGIASMTAQDWFSGENKPVEKVSLDPAKQQVKPKKATSEAVTVDTKTIHVENEPENTAPKVIHTQPPQQTNIPAAVTEGSVWKPPPKAEPKTYHSTASSTKTYKFTAVRTSKFKYIHSEKHHKRNNIENVRNLAASLAGESDGFQGYDDLLAFPLAGPGGQIAVVQSSKPGRLPEAGMPVLLNGSNLQDFVMDPFDNRNIAAATEDAFIRVWRVPSDGLSETLDTPDVTLKGHFSKVNLIRYHPTASNLLTSASYDMTIRLWNTSNGEELFQFEIPEQAFSLAWNPDGDRLAVFTKDGYIRIYDPRENGTPLKEWTGPEGLRGGRIVWGGPDNKWIIASGFNKSSARSITVYDTENCDKPVGSFELDTSPAILVVHYDEDSSTLFAYSKGDTTIYSFEISSESPHIIALSPCKFPDLHQGYAFLRKDICNVRDVEFARAARLTKSTIEKVSFTVPRVKKEFFQDDLFPETRMKWQAALSCEEWAKGENKIQPKKSLKPSDMVELSKAPTVGKSKKYESKNEIDAHKSTEQKKEELISAMVEKLGDQDGEKLFQDTMEGVDEDEWDD